MFNRVNITGGIGAVGAMLIASGFAGSTIATARDQAAGGGRNYSIHILAKIPSICALRDMSRVIRLFEEHDDEDHLVRGLHDFRIDCNVPYAVDVQRIRHHKVRGRVIPLSGDAEVDYGVTLEVPGVAGPVRSHCAGTGMPEGVVGCAGLGGSDDTRQLMPRAKARMVVVRRQKQAVPVVAASEMDEVDGFVPQGSVTQDSATTGSVTTTSAGAPIGQPSHLTLSLTARF